MATPTGGADMAKRAASPGKKKGKGTRPASPFLASAPRQMHLEIMGEETPGPGAYLPASTFGKYASSSNKQFAKLASPNFRSSSTQRPRVRNTEFPGPGAHTPNKAATSEFKNRTNSAPNLKAKGNRFSHSAVSASESSTPPGMGPGAYDAHKFNSVAMNVAKEVQMMSRQNPGFGIAGPAHKLPHEQPVEDDKELPGPGKYETNTGTVNTGSGHGSSFKPPTARKKSSNNSYLRDDQVADVPVSRGKKGSKKSAAAVPGSK